MDGIEIQEEIIFRVTLESPARRMNDYQEEWLLDHLVLEHGLIEYQSWSYELVLFFQRDSAEGLQEMIEVALNRMVQEVPWG